MKKSLFLFIISQFIIVCSFAISSNLSGVINSYAAVTTIFPGACNDSLQAATTTGFRSGETVLIIQMQGVTIDSSNSVSFGTIINYGNSGNYEFLKIAFINGTIIHFTTVIKNNYDMNGMVQLLTVPSYVNANVTGTLNAMPWNGSTGGVLVFTASGTVTLNADINTDGNGFTGGPLIYGTFNCGAMNYYYSIPSYNGGEKGEGIATYILNKECGRGAQANGGGGGNNNNAGGAGGGNYGSGGRGGNQVLFQNCTALPIGGEAGKNLTYSPAANKIFLGGGGGGGQQNDNNNVGVDGKNGGGIVIIRCDTLIGNNHRISSDGLDNNLLVTTDGAGGGGAGGTILLDVNNFTSNLNIEVKGGNGGSSISSVYCLGTGGGGGGGAILYSHNILPLNVIADLSGGLAGTESISNNSCSGSNWGAANGQDGAIINNWTISLFADAGPDQTICRGDQVQIGTPALNGLTYTWNNGAGNVANPYVSPLITTTYILTVNTSTCGNFYDTVTVYIDSTQIIVNPDTSICFGSSVQLVASNGVTYSWVPLIGLSNDTIASPVATPMATTTYTVTAITTNGCKDSALIAVTVNPDPPTPYITQSHDTLFCTTNPSYKSYQWYFNYALQSGSTDTFLVISQGGNYNVQVVDTDGCQISVGIILILGLNEFEQDGYISLYPVPVISKMNLSFNNIVDKAEIEINDILGRKIFERNFDKFSDDKLTLDLSDLSSGYYFISIIIDGNKVMKKFVKG